MIARSAESVSPSRLTSAQLENPESAWKYSQSAISALFTTPSRLMSPGHAGCDANSCASCDRQRVVVLFLFPIQRVAGCQQVGIGGVELRDRNVFVDSVKLFGRRRDARVRGCVVGLEAVDHYLVAVISDGNRLQRIDVGQNRLGMIRLPNGDVTAQLQSVRWYACGARIGRAWTPPYSVIVLAHAFGRSDLRAGGSVELARPVDFAVGVEVRAYLGKVRFADGSAARGSTDTAEWSARPRSAVRSRARRFRRTRRTVDRDPRY